MINSVLRGTWVTQTYRNRLANLAGLRTLIQSCQHQQQQQQQQQPQISSEESEPLQLTLAIIKPHICKDPFSVQEILQLILEDNFHFIRSTRKELTKREAEHFYSEHNGKFFYNPLLTFMSSGEISVHILARKNAISRWRSLMGPTKVYKTRLENPHTIRGRFGTSDTRNATHGSDSIESAAREIAFFFPDFSIKNWYDNEEAVYRRGVKEMIAFDESTWQHRIVIPVDD